MISVDLLSPENFGKVFYKANLAKDKITVMVDGLEYYRNDYTHKIESVIFVGIYSRNAEGDVPRWVTDLYDTEYYFVSDDYHEPLQLDPNDLYLTEEDALDSLASSFIDN